MRQTQGTHRESIGDLIAMVGARCVSAKLLCHLLTVRTPERNFFPDWPARTPTRRGRHGIVRMEPRCPARGLGLGEAKMRIGLPLIALVRRDGGAGQRRPGGCRPSAGSPSGGSTRAGDFSIWAAWRRWHPPSAGRAVIGGPGTPPLVPQRQLDLVQHRPRAPMRRP
jgi:hypothetical protein